MNDVLPLIARSSTYDTLDNTRQLCLLVKLHTRLTGAFAHAVDLHDSNVQTVEKLERLFHHRRCGRHEQFAAVEAESPTHRAKHKQAGQCPTIRQAASEHSATTKIIC